MLITTSFQPFCSLCQSANWLIRWFCLSLSSPERSWVKRRSLSFPVSSIWFVFSRSPSYFCHDVMIPLRTDWTRGRRESNWQPLNDQRERLVPLQHLPSHHKLNVHVVSPQRATVATSKRWKTTRWFDLSDFTQSEKDKRRYFCPAVIT